MIWECRCLHAFEHKQHTKHALQIIALEQNCMAKYRQWFQLYKKNYLRRKQKIFMP